MQALDLPPSFAGALKSALLGLFLLAWGPVALGASLTLVVTPANSPEQTRKNFEGLARYLSEHTGRDVQLATARNFFAYWEQMKKGDYDLILDPAHFTDFRVKRMGYEVIAKVPEVLSFSLVSSEDELILEPSELIAKPVASLASPSLGAVFLSQMYPSMIRQPVTVEVDNAQAAVAAIKDGKAVAAIIPTPMVGSFSGLSLVETTEQVPALAFSVAPTVDAETRAKLKKALIEAGSTPEGKKMLEVARIAGFESADDSIYDGYASLLEGVWGY
jgi:ABC-type phosphate/phosphonate transport system substrate-binding protein